MAACMDKGMPVIHTMWAKHPQVVDCFVVDCLLPQYFESNTYSFLLLSDDRKNIFMLTCKNDE